MRTLFVALTVLASLLIRPAIAADAPALTPYQARYQVKYRGMSGGDIEFTLKSLGDHRFEFSSHLLPNFLGSLFTSDQAEDSSVMTLDEHGLRPQQFRSEDGSRKTDKDLRYDFDWNAKRVTGRARNQDFTLSLPGSVHDRMSIQLAASLALQAGQEPGKLIMLERNELQEYLIVRQGTEKLRTSVGELDTIVLKSERSGSSRSTRYWYAPKLGYIPVRAERTTKGKVDIVMELRSYQRL